MVLASLVMAKLVATNHVNAVHRAASWAPSSASPPRALNGMLVTRLKLPPFIVTLGTLGIFTAITLIYAQGQTVSLHPDSFVLWTGKTHRPGILRSHQRRHPHGPDLRRRVLRFAKHGVGAAPLRHRRRHRGRAPGRYPHRPGVLSRLRRRRRDHRMAAWVLFGRVGGGDPNSATNANLELDHRRRHRRHQPVRRPRRGGRHPDRRARSCRCSTSAWRLPGYDPTTRCSRSACW